MNIKLLFYFFIITLLFVMCSEDEKGLTILTNPENFIPENIPLSVIAESIEYIPIDNRVLISTIFNVKTDINCYYVSTSNGVMVYNTKGTYLRKIGKKGNGPGEYISGRFLAINTDNQDVYILDQYKIQVFSFQGKFKRTIDLKKFGSQFQDIDYNSGRIYLFKTNMYEDDYQWISLDTLGSVRSTKKNPLKPFPVRIGYWTRSYKFDNKMHYWNHYNDTIYEIGTESVKSKYFFAKGQFRIPTETILDNSSYLKIHRIIESKRYLFIDYSMQNNYCLAIVNKGKMTNHIVSSIDDFDKKPHKLGFTNDFDCGMPFMPHGYVIIDNKEYLFTWIDSFNLIAYLKNSKYINATPLFPEKKKALEQLANSLNENDNPVLMLVKLKE